MDDYNRGWRLIGQRREAEGIAILKALIERDPSFPGSYRTLARTLSRSGRRQEAVSYFETLLERDPENGYAHLGLAVVYQFAPPPLMIEHGRIADHATECIRRRPEALHCYDLLAYGLSGGRTGAGAVPLGEVLKVIPPDLSNPFRYIALTNANSMNRLLPEARRAAQTGLALAKQRDLLELEAWFSKAIYGLQNIGAEISADDLAHGERALGIYRSLGMTDEEAHLVWALAGKLEQLGDSRKSDEYEAELARRVDETGHRDLRQLLLYLQAMKHANRGRPDQAVQSLRQSAEQYLKDRDAMLAANSLMRAAEYQIQLTQYRDAIDTAREGLRLSPLCNSDAEAFLRRMLGIALAHVGDYFGSIRESMASVRLFEEAGMEWQAGAGLGRLAVPFARLGDYPAALHYANQSYVAAVKQKDRDVQRRNLMLMAEISLRAGETRKAIGYLERANELAEVVRLNLYDSTNMLLLELASRRLGRYAEAERYLSQALEIARKSSLRSQECEALVEFGNLFLHQGELEQAGRYFEEGLKLSEMLGAKELILASRSGLSDIAYRRKQFELALTHVYAALEVSESLRARHPSAESRIAFLEETSSLFDNGVDALWELGRREPERTLDREAWDIAERFRARSLLDALGSATDQVTAGLTAEEVRRRSALYSELSQASGLHIRKPSPETWARLDAATRELTDWIGSLKSGSSGYADLIYPQPCILREVQDELLSPGEALLQFHAGSRRSYGWVVTRGAVQIFALPARDVLEAQVEKFRSALASRPEGSSRERSLSEESAGLYRLLVQPAEPLLAGVKRLIVVPSGLLHYLPIEALSRQTEQGTQRYVLEDFVVSYVPSASVLASVKRRKLAARPAAQRELLAFGDPVFGKELASATSMAAAVRSVYRSKGLRFARLPASALEVQAIAKLFPASSSSLRLRSDASEAVFKRQDLSAFRRIHFATHALIDENAPENSGVVFSLVHTGAEDGILRLPEILNLQFETDLVVLSACQTGMGKRVKGEGIMGLARAFFYAGVPRIAVSLWEVNDRATADLMKAFYEEMMDGGATASALRRAKLRLLSSGVPAYRHPHFWAPFVLAGLE